mmetsp:Transcript_12504/g.18739  ORF Transcript_12504/g.18739 Transcript_12504/m.18739 type:complete len:267 (+) Transcript_12504:23-823(+)
MNSIELFIILALLFQVCHSNQFNGTVCETYRAKFQRLKESAPSTTELFEGYNIVMSTNERDLMANMLRNARIYYEFGCGGSTLLSARVAREPNSTLKLINSADSSLPWIEKLKNDSVLSQLTNSDQLALHHVDIGEIGNWGHPSSRKNMTSWKKYSETIWKYGRTADLILVDGRFRIACALQTLYASNFPLDVSFEQANQTISVHPRDITIMIHDFTKRDHYHKVLEYLDVIECIDTLVVMKPKNYINLQQLRNDILRSHDDPYRN